MPGSPKRSRQLPRQRPKWCALMDRYGMSGSPSPSGGAAAAWSSALAAGRLIAEYGGGFGFGGGKPCPQPGWDTVAVGGVDVLEQFGGLGRPAQVHEHVRLFARHVRKHGRVFGFSGGGFGALVVVPGVVEGHGVDGLPSGQ